jgi:hypothetical protein
VARSKEVWKKYFGITGIIIYNALHPRASVPANDAMDVDQQLPEPKLAHIKMNASSLLEFLEKNMDTNKLHSVPHVIREEGLLIRLCGRDLALQQAATCMKNLKRSGTDKGIRKIPVCSGLPGLGKTRMLEE